MPAPVVLRSTRTSPSSPGQDKMAIGLPDIRQSAELAALRKMKELGMVMPGAAESAQVCHHLADMHLGTKGLDDLGRIMPPAYSF